MPRERVKYCKLCEDKIDKSMQIELHPECVGALYLIENIYNSLDKGNMSQDVRDFLRELDFIIIEDPRFKPFFNTASYVILKSVRDTKGLPFSKDDLPIVLKKEYESDIFETLKLARLCYIASNNIILGEMGRKICEQLMAGGAITEVAKLLAEIKGIITVVLAYEYIKAWRQGKETRVGIPKNSLIVFTWLGRLLMFPSIDLTTYVNVKEMWWKRERGRLIIDEDQLFRLLSKLIGNTKLFESMIETPQGHFAKPKPELQEFIQRYRERLREERARGG